MSAPNCVVVSGEYGDFQLVDPMDRRSTGYVTLLLPNDDEAHTPFQVEFHFYFIQAKRFHRHREEFERDLRSLIKFQFPMQFGNFASRHLGSIAYTDPNYLPQ